MKGLCYFKQSEKDIAALIRILNAAIVIKTNWKQFKMPDDFLSFYLKYDPKPNFRESLEIKWQIDVDSLIVSDENPKEVLYWETIKKLENGLEVNYENALGVSKNNIFVLLGNFLEIEEILKQVICLIKTELMFVQIAEVVCMVEGVYMSLAEEDFGSIFFAECYPEFALPEQIHPLAKDFTEFMGMLAIYQFRHAAIMNFKESAKRVAWCKEN